MFDNHEQALDLREQAPDALDSGRNEFVDQLLDQVKSLDLSAAEEAVADLDVTGDLADPEDDPEDEDEDEDDEDEDDEDEDDEEEDDVPGIDEEDDEDPAEEDEEE